MRLSLYNRSMPRVVSQAVLIVLLLSTIAAEAGQNLPPLAPIPPDRPPFDVWLAEVRAEAGARGIRPEVVAAALTGIAPVEQVLERDRTQAEFTLDLESYLNRRLTGATVRTAQQMYTRHRTLLRRVGETYGVDPRILVSVWGLESNFGKFPGVRPTIPVLATLAYDPRRSAMFRAELFHALEILNRGDIELAKLKGSWAGALGQPQFMPSSYLKFAQDFDNDGRRDIWSSLPDVFASIAFYMQQHGWTAGVIWGREVLVPAAARDAVLAVPRRETGCRAERSMSAPLPLSEWTRLGVSTVARGRLPQGDRPASLVVAGTRHFLVYSNYEALLGYNCAHSYALSVALLAEKLK
jgi:membrane-bound lytic murein transglycosylase B